MLVIPLALHCSQSTCQVILSMTTADNFYISAHHDIVWLNFNDAQLEERLSTLKSLVR